MLRKFYWILLLVLMTAAGTVWGATGQDTLKVGMELAYPPFEMTDKTGRPAGISVDLANDLGKALGKKVVIQNMAFDGLIPALKTGKIDLVISSMTATEERAKSIDFSEPYLQTGLCLLLSSRTGAKGIGDLNRAGIKVAVKKGTTGHIYASKNLPKAEMLVLDKEAAAVLEVVQGKADAFIYDQMSIYQHWQRNQTTTRAILAPFQQESWAIGIRKGNRELIQNINVFIRDYRGKGGFERLGDKYLKEMKGEFRRLGYPFFL